MNIKVTKDKVEILNSNEIHKGEYKVNKLHFTFSEEYLPQYVKKAIFIGEDKTPYEMVIAENECDIPYFDKSQEVIIGVYAYEVNSEELLVRYSPTPTKYYVYQGSYIENAESPTQPTPDEFEQYYQQMQDIIVANQEILDGASNVNVTSSKVGNTTTITTTDRTGTDTTTTIEDGIDGIGIESMRINDNGELIVVYDR